jgi:hypothetical protein
VSFLNPGANAWVVDYDPFTIIGDTAWTDYTLRVTGVSYVVLPTVYSDTAHAGAALKDGAPAALAPCNASDAFQQWTWNSPASDYLSNTASSQVHRRCLGMTQCCVSFGRFSRGALSFLRCWGQCLNVYGCQTNVVYWSCVTSGGTCEYAASLRRHSYIIKMSFALPHTGCGPDCYNNLKVRRSAQVEGVGCRGPV